MALRDKQKTGKANPYRFPTYPNHPWMPLLKAFSGRGRTLNYSELTIRNRERAVQRFIHWCVERDLLSLTDLTRQTLEAYQRSLSLYRQPNGKPIASTTQENLLIHLKSFFKWLTRENYLNANPAADLDMPRQPKKLPEYVMSPAQVAQLMTLPDIRTDQGMRDRAILETLYTTGMRRFELIALKVNHLDFNGDRIFIRQGKGQKDRVVPMGERAHSWLEKYLNDVHPLLLLPTTKDILFLTDYGEPLVKNRLTDMVKGYLVKIGVDAGACHLLRHAMATHMLENGADTRHIQMILGHKDLSSTQIYTHVSIKSLQEVHRRTHPTSLNQRRKEDD